MPFYDTHFHVFTNTLPMVADRRYAPAYEATPDMHQKLSQAAGLTSGILIQPSFLGTDNSYMLTAIKARPQALCGVAVVAPTASPEELAALKAGGIVGIRFNLIGKAIPDFSAPVYQTLFSRVRELGWHVEIHRNAKDFPAFLPVLMDAGVRVVIDHFGLPDPRAPFADPGFEYLLGLGGNGRIWVKISAPYRTRKENMGLDFAREAAPRLIESFGPGNILWGSDWPHTRFEDVVDYPAVCAAFKSYVPQRKVREAILEDAPRRLMACQNNK